MKFIELLTKYNFVYFFSPFHLQKNKNALRKRYIPQIDRGSKIDALYNNNFVTKQDKNNLKILYTLEPSGRKTNIYFFIVNKKSASSELDFC